MSRGARAFRKLSLTGILVAGFVGTGAAHADDLFNSLTPVPETQMEKNSGQGVTLNIGNTSQDTSNDLSASISNTSMKGLFVNGGVGGNTVSNNQGLTSVMMNTGNNVNMNNSFTVNVIMH